MRPYLRLFLLTKKTDARNERRNEEGKTKWAPLFGKRGHGGLVPKQKKPRRSETHHGEAVVVLFDPRMTCHGIAGQISSAFTAPPVAASIPGA